MYSYVLHPAGTGLYLYLVRYHDPATFDPTPTETVNNRSAKRASVR